MKIISFGLGKMGSSMVERLVRDGHQVVATDLNSKGFEIMEAKKEFELNLSRISHLWNQGIRGYVEDSGEGRWTVAEAIGENVPAPVITLSLLERFRSRQQESFSNKVISALRHAFGGHGVKKE